MAVTAEQEPLKEETLEEILWRELADEDGEVDITEISGEWLESLRRRIRSGKLPAFITTDYREGWQHYARSEVRRRFMRYRQRVGGHNVRSFFPVFQTMHAGPWTTTEQDAEKSVAHSRKRMSSSIRGSILLHGSKLVAFGQATWDEVRADACTTVEEAVTEGIRLEEMAKKDYPELPYEEWAKSVEQDESASA